MHVHLHQLRLVIIPDRLEVHSLTAASADITNEVQVSFSTISDIITSVEALASRYLSSTVEGSLLTFMDVIDIETRSTEAESEARKTTSLGIDVDRFLVVVEESPLVGAAALGFNNRVELLATNIITLIDVSELVLSWAAAGGEDGAASLLEFFTAGVVVDEDNFFSLDEVIEVGANFSLTGLVGLTKTVGHVRRNHSHF